jgi:hypothetical protein
MKRSMILGLGVLLAAAPAAFAADPAYKPPRNSFGQPDFTGAWSNATLTPQVRPALYGTRKALNAEEVKILESANVEKLEEGNKGTDVNAGAGGASDNVGAYDRAWIDNGVKVMRVRGEPRTSLITTADGAPPPRKGATPRTLPANAGSREAGLQAARQAASVNIFDGQGSVRAARAGSYDNPEARGAGERCLISFGRNGGPPMFPNGWYNNNYQIVQSRDAVVINIEMVHDTRIVRLNDKHRTDGVRPWFGDSIGHYEGDSLVVETTNIPRQQAYNGSWENLKVTERFTRVAKDRVLYQFTVEDPTLWDKPWGGEYEFYPLNGQLQEYACHEGNYALEGILAGAREEERKAALATQPVAAK